LSAANFWNAGLERFLSEAMHHPAPVRPVKSKQDHFVLLGGLLESGTVDSSPIAQPLARKKDAAVSERRYQDESKAILH
jgi:hypothetical protein